MEQHDWMKRAAAVLAAAAATATAATTPLRAAEKSFLLSPGAQWPYYTGDERLGADWAKDHADALVTGKGAAPLGYGYDSVATELPARGDFALPFAEQQKGKYPAAYFAKDFSVERSLLPPEQEAVAAFVACDDGCIVFVNGVELGRIRMPDGEPASYSAEGVGKVTGFASLPLPVSLLRDGRNTIAVEVHQQHQESSDLFFDAAVTLANPDYLPY